MSLHLHRRILPRGASHPIQISMYFVDEEDEVLLKKILLHCDGQQRKFAVKPGRYILRAREVPIGCNFQGEELFFDISLDADDEVYVVVRVGSFFQVLSSGFGACLMPRSGKFSQFSQRSFYMDQVSREAFENETRKATQRKSDIRHLVSNNVSSRGVEVASPRIPPRAPLHHEDEDGEEEE